VNGPTVSRCGKLSLQTWCHSGKLRGGLRENLSPQSSGFLVGNRFIGDLRSLRVAGYSEDSQGRWPEDLHYGDVLDAAGAGGDLLLPEPLAGKRPCCD
jgi:hypothetical protein